MLKKIIVLLMCITALFTVTAYATPDVTVTNIVQKISVKATIDSEKSPLTLKVFKLDAADADGNGDYTYDMDDLIYVAQLDSPTSNTESSFTYEFEEFGTPPSGKYRAIIGGNIASKDFRIVTNEDKREYYRAFSSKTTDTMKAHIQDGIDREILGFNIGGYLSFDTVLDRVNSALVNIEWPELSETANAEEVSEYETALKPVFEEIIKVGTILNASETDFDTLIDEYDEALGIDCVYYNDQVLNIDHSKVYSNLMAIAPEATKEALKEAFNVAVLITIAQDCDYGTLTNSLKYYDGKGINLDKTYSSNMSETDLNKVSILIKQDAALFTNAGMIENSYLTRSQEVKLTPQIPNPTPSDNTNSNAGHDVSVRPAAPSGTGIVNNNNNNNNNQPEKKPQHAVAFKDLDSAVWAREAIEHLASKGILAGRDNEKFYPSDEITREEFVKVIVVAFDLTDDTATVDFSDIEGGRWSEKYIASAAELGIISGVTETSFMPESNLSRQQMAAIIYRTYTLFSKDETEQIKFNDHAEIDDYAKDAVGVLAAEGIINGMGNNNFEPKGVVTRAQAAQIVYGLLNAIDNAE